MTQYRLVLQPTKPTQRLEIDTVEVSPAERILLVAEGGGAGPTIQFGIAAPTTPYTLPADPTHYFRLTGTSGALIDVAWGDGESSNSSMTGGEVYLEHTYDTADQYTGNLSNDTDQLTKIRAANIPFWFDLGQLSSGPNLTELRLVGVDNITNSLSNVPSTVSFLELNADNASGISGNLADLPSSLTSLYLRTGAIYQNTNVSDDIGDLTTSSLTKLDVNEFTNITCNVSSLITDQPSLTYLRLYSIGTLSGSIDALSDSITYLTIGESGAGATGSLNNLPTSATFVYLTDLTGLTGSINSLPTNLTHLQLQNCGTSITGGFDGSFPLNLHGLILSNTGNFTNLDIGNLPNSIYYLAIQSVNNQYEYTSKTWPAYMEYATITPAIASGNGLSSSEVDQILIDLDSDVSVWAGAKRVNLTGDNAHRTSASDTAVSNLISAGVTVEYNTTTTTTLP